MYVKLRVRDQIELVNVEGSECPSFGCFRLGADTTEYRCKNDSRKFTGVECIRYGSPEERLRYYWNTKTCCWEENIFSQVLDS